ncbi:MAG: hypothetical protein HND47_09345 [Chloroflexi bacterium]|nr:hypothetical protein [Chloroflexota bacterium]
MVKVLLSLTAAFSLLFGGAAIADEVQDSQPGSPLYAVKEWTVQEQNRFQTGEPAEDAYTLQTRERDRQRDQTCDPLLNPDCDPLQDRTRDRDRKRDHTCDPLLNPDCDPLQDRTRERDRKRDHTCDPSLNPDCEPIQDQTQDQLQTQTQLHLHETDPQHLNGDGTCGDCEPHLEPGPHGNGGNGNNP